MRILIKNAVKREPNKIYYIDWLGNLCVVDFGKNCHGLTRDGSRCLNKGQPEFCRLHMKAKLNTPKGDRPRDGQPSGPHDNENH